MKEEVAQIIEALQAHLQGAELVDLGQGRTFRQPVEHITCRDGTVFSIQSSQFTYCTPRNDQGPWTHVEVMTLTEGVEPNWEQDADQIGAYVPIELVAQEIFNRSFLLLNSGTNE